MAEIRELTLPIRIDTSDFKKLRREAHQLASDLEGIGKRGGRSTFSQFNQELDRSALKIGVIGGLVGGLASQFAVAAAQALRTIAAVPVRLFDARRKSRKRYAKRLTPRRPISGVQWPM